MVPWSWPAATSADDAASALQAALKREGGQEVRASAIGAGAVRVSARFGAGPLGFIRDDAEFVLSGGSCAFRAASSTGGFPFSSSGMAKERNRKRLLRVRATLFDKAGWACGCPADANPFAALKCSLTCS